MFLPQAIKNAQAGAGEIDEATAIGFFLGFVVVGGLALIGLVLSIIGTVIGRKKMISIFGIVICVLPPITYIVTCAVLGAYLGATGQL